MLGYVGTGTRDYHRNILPVHARPFWEFQAVLSGSIAMEEEDGPGIFKGNTLWLTKPGHRHGWAGEPNKPAEVAVFHFPSIPEPLRRHISSRGVLEVNLPAEGVLRIRSVAESVAAEWRQPSPLTLLKTEHALLDLSLLICEVIGDNPAFDKSPAADTVRRAIEYFTKHLGANPGIEEAARASGTSPSQLRRFFLKIMDASPKEVLNRIRFQRAIQLMAEPDCKLATVAEECGFENLSSFSRAFRQRFGYSPSKWR